ncbi:phosphoserine phosphatase SerB [Halobacteriales archaeon QS_8_65_32]|nr:MAG: phosphoserine phosphatase SerB [Halobacteriales archaeon QS_8_65_32]
MTLVAFDFDGTLSDSEMTILLGEQCGVADRMAAITDRTMAGEIGYAESLRERVSLLEGLALDRVEAAFVNVRLQPGAAEVLSALVEAGVTTAVLTGGFERGVEGALADTGVTTDYTYANRLLDDGEALTGDVAGPLIEGTKDDVLRALADDSGISIENTIAVGDGANDRPMLAAAGVAIGYDPKPAVEPACDVTVASMADLRATLEGEGVLPER